MSPPKPCAIFRAVVSTWVSAKAGRAGANPRPFVTEMMRKRSKKSSPNSLLDSNATCSAGGKISATVPLNFRPDEVLCVR